MTVTESNFISGWHFTDGMKLRDSQDLIPGKIYHHPGKLTLCPDKDKLSHGGGGYHSSRHIIDALKYAPGPTVSYVRSWGNIIEDDDKLVAEYRQPVWCIDISIILHEFACRCAESALRVCEITDARCWNAIAAKRKWLRGEISDEELYAAMDAAWAVRVGESRDKKSAKYAAASSAAYASAYAYAAWAWAADVSLALSADKAAYAAWAWAADVSSACAKTLQNKLLTVLVLEHKDHQIDCIKEENR